MIFDTELTEFNSGRPYVRDDYSLSQFSTDATATDIYDDSGPPDMVMDDGYMTENNDHEVNSNSNNNHNVNSNNNFSINPIALSKFPELGEESSNFRAPLEPSDDNIFKSNSPYAPLDQFTIPGYDLKTVVPSEAMIKSPEDCYYGQRLGNAPFSAGMDSDLQFYVDPQETYSASGPMPFETFENPEDDYDDEDDDDDDENDYDDDDLYSPNSELESTSASSINRGFATAKLSHSDESSLLPRQPQHEGDEDEDSDFDDDHVTSLASHTNSSALHETSHDGLISSRNSNKKRVASAGPHRCELINHSTGEMCNKIFSRPYDLIRHQDTIHAAVRKTFKCDICGDTSKTFSRLDALSRHIRVKHS